MTQAEDIAKYLEHLNLPASKNEIVHAAKKAGAPKELWKMMDKQLPWLTFQHPNDILEPLGLAEEHREEKAS